MSSPPPSTQQRDKPKPQIKPDATPAKLLGLGGPTHYDGSKVGAEDTSPDLSKPSEEQTSSPAAAKSASSTPERPARIYITPPLAGDFTSRMIRHWLDLQPHLAALQYAIRHPNTEESTVIKCVENVTESVTCMKPGIERLQKFETISPPIAAEAIHRIGEYWAELQPLLVSLQTLIRSGPKKSTFVQHKRANEHNAQVTKRVQDVNIGVAKMELDMKQLVKMVPKLRRMMDLLDNKSDWYQAKYGLLSRTGESSDERDAYVTGHWPFEELYMDDIDTHADDDGIVMWHYNSDEEFGGKKGKVDGKRVHENDDDGEISELKKQKD